MRNKTELTYIYKNTKQFFPIIIFRSLLSCFGAVLLFSFSILSGRVLDIAMGEKEGNITLFTCLLFAAIATYVFFTGFGNHLNTKITARISHCLQRRLFSAICTKKMDKTGGLHSGDILTRFTEDVNAVTRGVSTIIPSVVSFISKIIAGFSSLFILNPMLGLIFLVCGLIFPAISRLVSNKYKYLHKETSRTEGVSRSFLQECFANMTVIKSFSATLDMENRLSKLQKDNFSFVAKRSILSVITHIGLYAVFTVGYYIALVWGAGQLASGLLTYGTLMATLQIMSHLRQPLQGITGVIPTYLSMVASAERICETLEKEDEPPLLSEPEITKLKADFKSLDIKNLTFGYSEKAIFNNANFSVARGDIVAITGPSGVGKTTLFRLLLGLLEAESGEILFNEREKVTASHRGMFAFVPQGNMILSGSIRENIIFVCKDADEEKIIKAAKDAGIYDFITSLPNGFDTILSERGAGLSEGQIKRIAIARALLTDAPILLLDECSSALDEQTEKELLSHISSLKDKTVLFITHRENVLSICNKQIRLGL